MAVTSVMPCSGCMLILSLKKYVQASKTLQLLVITAIINNTQSWQRCESFPIVC